MRRSHSSFITLAHAVGVYFCLLSLRRADTFSAVYSRHGRTSLTSSKNHFALFENSNKQWTSDFDDYVGDDVDNQNSNDDERFLFANLVAPQQSFDLSACQSRLFSLGVDLILTDFVGNMGFDQVTDWEYYYEDEDNPVDRRVINPNPFDKSKPKRTRSSSGSLVRVFRGEWMGRLGGMIRAKGLDRRVLVKEFYGEMALNLAQSELRSIGRLQSELLSSDERAQEGSWIQSAAARSTTTSRQDDANVARLLQQLTKAPFLGILGEVNLAELEGNPDANLFYRALKVQPPKPDAIWIVYEYAGLTTISDYAQPAEQRRARLPPKRNFLGFVESPSPVPSFQQRANYVVKGVVKQALEAVATLHDAGIVHRSIGKSSFILTRTTMDKREASSIYATLIPQLRIKLGDFGFSGWVEDSVRDEEFCARARSFGLYVNRKTPSIGSTNFAIAEDLHALGFVFLALLLASLAEIPIPSYRMPAIDEDTLQRLLGDIFEKDINQFREYVEAEDIWSKLVGLLDQDGGAGWKLLETLFLARERAAANKDDPNVLSARGLLSSPFLN